MAKLIYLSAFLATLLVAAHVVSAYHTTITTINVDEDDNPRRTGECQEQIRSEDINQCRSFLMEQARQSEQGRGEGRREGRGEQSRTMDACCQQLERMDESCRCEGIRQVVMEQQGRMRGQELQEMMRTARTLPSMCKIQPQQCEFRAFWV